MQKLTNEKARELLKELQYAKVQMGGQLSIRDEYFKQALEKMPRWIPCSERMPDEGAFCLGFDTEGITWTANVNSGVLVPDAGQDGADFTHWMPLPEAPL